jgi:uncharacterized protein (DUF362 family)
MERVAVQKADKNVKASVKNLVNELGGFGKFVKQGDTVLIKPNYNTADAPPASTSLDFLQAAVELCFEAGASKVFVGESSMFSMFDHSDFTRNTLCEACVYDLEKLPDNPEVYIFDEHDWVKKKIPEGNYLQKVSVPKILDEVDRIILLPCCKTHHIAQFTGALKIMVGFMKPTERIKLHTGDHVPEKVAEMNTIYKPDLIIMDARKCFISGGPAKGEVREPGLLMASESRVAIDIEAVKLIQGYSGNSLEGIAPEEMRQIKYAIELGIE